MIPQFPEFTLLDITHGELYAALAHEMELTNADLSFPEVFSWRETYIPYLSMIDDALCLKLFFEDRIILFPPIGKISLSRVFDRYAAYLTEKHQGGYIGGLTKKDAESTGLKFRFDRNNSDYVYALNDLAQLPGKKYHSKRNLIRQFEKNNACAFSPLDCSNIEGCLALSESWCDLKRCDLNPALHDEERAVKQMLAYCKHLNLFGGVITVDNKIIAFTVASKLNNTTVVTHVEKADTSFKGIYQAINYYFARSQKDTCIWINRESDVGNEGLRKAKLSYYPAHLNEKYYIKIHPHTK
ncbi:MAG: phosphatidylglycerol lysyltransferase domain-containing protein [bacterium]